MRYAHCDDRHPSPHWDRELMGIGDAEHCAFDSPDALTGWFEHEYRVLLFAHGFKVFEYEVPEEHARTGEYGQTLFKRAHATLISTTDLTD
jgi:hypothetical protein